jgi:hypothetical protein
VKYHINFTANGIEYRLEFKGRVSKIGGYSGSGKTLFAENLAHYYASINKTEKIAVFDYSNRYRDGSGGGSGRIIVIDNADLIIGKEEIKAINEDKGNQYVLLSRLTMRGLKCRLSDHYEMYLEGKTVRIRASIKEDEWYT